MRLGTLILVGIVAFFIGRAVFQPVSPKKESQTPTSSSAPASEELCDLDAGVLSANFENDHDPDAGIRIVLQIVVVDAELDAGLDWTDPDAWVTPPGVYPGE